MPDSPVKAVFFDIDDTLVNDAAAIRAGALGIFERYRDRLGGCDERLMQRWQALLDHHFERFLRRETSFVDQRRARIREMFGVTRAEMPDSGVDAIHAVYREFYEANWRVFPDAIETLDTLAPFRLGVISNGSSAQQRQKLAQVGIQDRFAAVVISEDIGVGKPDPRIFWEACETVRAPPAACLHVGDRLDADAHGARDAGLTGVWLNRRGEDAGILDVPTIERLSELPALVTRRRVS